MEQIDCLTLLLVDFGEGLDLVGQVLDRISVTSHLFIKFLLKTLHEGVHHDVAIRFDLEGALQFRVLFLQLGLILLFLLNEFLGVLDLALQFLHRLLRV